MNYKHYTDALRKIKSLLDTIDLDYKDTQYIKREKRTLLNMFTEIQKQKEVTPDQSKILNNITIKPRINMQVYLFNNCADTVNMFEENQ